MRRIFTFIICAAVAVSFAPARTRPAAESHRPGKNEDYPPPRLVEKCSARSEEIQNRIAELDGEGFKVVVRAPFVVIGNMSGAKLLAYTERSVTAPAEAMWQSYFHKKPEHPIVIYLFADAETYETWSKNLFDDDDVPYFGFYRPSDRTLVMNIATGTGTLVHELTHALIAYDFPQVPTWFNEGLASLHEQCSVRKDGITGLVNWRLPGLQKAIKDDKLRSLEDLITKRDFYGRLGGLNYAQARYFVMYMQHRGLLKKFYRYFRENYDPDRSNDVEMVEHVFKSDISKIEQKFLAWVKSLRYPPEGESRSDD